MSNKCTLQSLTGSLQGENMVFLVKFSHTGKNFTGKTLFSPCNDPVRDCSGQIIDGDFAKFCGLLRIYEIQYFITLITKICRTISTLKKPQLNSEIFFPQSLKICRNFQAQSPFIICKTGGSLIRCTPYVHCRYGCGTTLSKYVLLCIACYKQLTTLAIDQ